MISDDIRDLNSDLYHMSRADAVVRWKDELSERLSQQKLMKLKIETWTECWKWENDKIILNTLLCLDISQVDAPFETKS